MDNPLRSIRINRPFPIPASVRAAILKLHEHGHVAYLVGGCVRDFLLHRPIKDHDIATSASPEELIRLFPDGITVGIHFGVLKVPDSERPGEVIEIATFREDLEYKDHRHPTAVRFAGMIEDARRRDFTINALYFDLKESRVLDTVGGVDDLRSKHLRAIGVPSDRFKEDALRLLRAVRFSVALGFEIDPRTLQAIETRAKLIQKISGERVREELNRMLTGENPVRAFELLRRTGLLLASVPELESMWGDSPGYSSETGLPGVTGETGLWKHALRTLNAIDRSERYRNPVLGWISIFQEMGKVLRRPVVSDHWENESAELAQNFGERLRFSGVDLELMKCCLLDQRKFLNVFSMREATLVRWIREPYFPVLLEFHRASSIASDGNLVYYEFCRSRWEEERSRPILPRMIGGQDLIEMGLKPGPYFSGILREVEDRILESRITSREQALEFALQLATQFEKANA